MECHCDHCGYGPILDELGVVQIPLYALIICFAPYLQEQPCPVPLAPRLVLSATFFPLKTRL